MFRVLPQLAMFLTAGFVAVGLGGVPARSAEVINAAYGVWSAEVVSRTDGNRRVACSASTGEEGQARLLISLTGSGVGADRVGELSAFIYEENGSLGGEALVDSAFRMTFRAGDATAVGRVVVKRAEDEAFAHSEAYPAVADVPRLLKAMTGAEGLSLSLGDDVMRSVPLDGFAEAYAMISEACAY
ncbi:MAG: hypothetical protein AAF367_03215 [Pseudomonadota bacterium]